MAVSGLSLNLGTSESSKTLVQKFIFQIGIHNPHGVNERFFSTNLFLFSRHHISTKSVAPLSAYKHTHNPHTTHNSSNRSDEGLTLETWAFNLFTVTNLRFQLSC